MGFIEEQKNMRLSERSIILATKHSFLMKLFAPGPYAKNISNLLGFDLNVTLWEMLYVNFRLRPNATRIPTWFAWGNTDSQSLFSGFSLDPKSDYIFITASFIQNLSNPLWHPSQRTNIPDPFIVEKIVKFAEENLLEVDLKDYFIKNRTCLATFLSDNSFIVDYVPNTNKKVLIQTAGWRMKFVPIWTDILSYMIFLESTDTSIYAKYLPYLSLSQPNRLITITQQSSNSSNKFSFLFYYFLILFILMIK